jgi:hypothetical protein
VAFPQIQGTAADYASSTSVLTHSINLPSGIQAGEKLLFILAIRRQTTAGDVSFATLSPTVVGTPTLQGASTGLWLYQMTATGSEPSTTDINVTVATGMTSRVIRLSGAGAIEQTGVALGSTLTLDPPSHTPSFGAQDTLWFAIAGNNNGAHTISASPANYTANSIQPGLSGAVTLGYATRELNASSEDPGAYTYSLASPSLATTIAVQPASGASLSRTPSDSIVVADASATLVNYARTRQETLAVADNLTTVEGWSGRTKPNMILGKKGLVGTLADISDDPDSPDSNWLVVG